MGKIYTLTFEEYCKLVTDIGLDLMPADTFGLDNFFPLKEISNLKKLHEQYAQRDIWFEDYLTTKLNINQNPTIIWGEAARVGNGKYVYSKDINANFKFEKKKTGYFDNVSEEVFGNSIIIDFFAPFGLNHTKSSREYLNKIYNNNSAIYNSYLEKYITSILNIIGYKYNQVMSLSNIIASPKDTRDSILNFFSSELKSTNLFKCYFLSQQSVTSKFDNLDLTKAIALRKKK